MSSYPEWQKAARKSYIELKLLDVEKARLQKEATDAKNAKTLRYVLLKAGIDEHPETDVFEKDGYRIELSSGMFVETSVAVLREGVANSYYARWPRVYVEIDLNAIERGDVPEIDPQFTTLLGEAFVEADSIWDQYTSWTKQIQQNNETHDQKMLRLLRTLFAELHAEGDYDYAGQDESGVAW